MDVGRGIIVGAFFPARWPREVVGSGSLNLCFHSWIRYYPFFSPAFHCCSLPRATCCKAVCIVTLKHNRLLASGGAASVAVHLGTDDLHRFETIRIKTIRDYALLQWGSCSGSCVCEGDATARRVPSHDGPLHLAAAQLSWLLPTRHCVG